MKGIVFTLFSELVEQTFGPAAWDRLLLSTGDSGIYTAAASYPDESINRLVGALSKQSGLATAKLIRTFGRFMLHGFVQQYPSFFPDGQNAKQLLMSVDGIIHVEVKKLFPDAVLPRFEYEDPAPDRLVMTYRSERGLCALAEGLIDGAGEHFGETITHRQTSCVHLGSDHCRFELLFSPVAARDSAQRREEISSFNP
ncbi:MAG: heme NO-binding domain-containing protein [Planctomycetaceae bacterium]|nr:heme NO-binding domain-containing protein [Planctomycetaceae bacterium]